MNIKKYAKYLGVSIGIIVLIFIFIFFFVIYPLKYKFSISYYANLNNVQPELIASMINAESEFNKNAVSSAGAIGLMQLMPKTAKWLCEKNGIEYNEKELLSADYNIMLGSLYISYLIKKFNNLDNAICAYNAGEGVVSLWLSSDKYSLNNTLVNIPYPETKKYLNKVKQGLSIYRIKLNLF